MSNVQIRRACAAGLGRRCARITSIRRRRGHWTASHSSAPTQLVPARESPRTMASDRVIHTRRAKVTLTRERRRRTERVPATIAPRRATTARPTEPLISFFGISFLSPPTSHRRNESDDRRRTWRRVLREIDAGKNERIELTNPGRESSVVGASIRFGSVHRRTGCAQRQCARSRPHSPIGRNAVHAVIVVLLLLLLRLVHRTCEVTVRGVKAVVISWRELDHAPDTRTRATTCVGLCEAGRRRALRRMF